MNATWTRAIALRRLWADALADLRFRHPDPAVDVEVSVHAWNTSSIRIEFDMFGLRDTVGGGPISPATPWGVRERPVFHTELFVDDWPGKRLARMAAIGTWVGYVNHEALELVSLEPVSLNSTIYYDPHGHPFAPSQALINDAACSRVTPGRLERLARFCFDTITVDRALADAESARAELRIEEDWVRSGELGG